mmetsp:Transcript_26143/g.31640  ORF Transcript_26143/g.31640 Transcript_26143/m.31640 type:complete len:195 (+) Transcript_26143:97-681(+)|eukprot:CAMPEP_0172516848 /NCGR_PEP_ID=MMETSP1066-20121228/279621_1 /TAXON_ID=671091 /ORGANISM="Coscinodiscus wailesii, Strain CCMP2513" /LENGTH=194 /DNA_ID=CAMNT_0013298513 /DNA_START=81 /DNA_END=665 /DNA_ORIENTATION=+
MTRPYITFYSLFCLRSLLSPTHSFCLSSHYVRSPQKPWAYHLPGRTPLALSVADPNEEISAQLAKAKELLAKTKEKLAAEASTEKKDSPGSTPHFASVKTDRSSVIKSRDPDSGLITTDGDKMAELSESEEWEARSLMDVFEWEEGEVSISRQKELEKMDRDTLKAMWGFRRTLQGVDFENVFDKRNRFIGETE